MQNSCLLASHKLSFTQLNKVQYSVQNILQYRVSGCLTMTGVAECGVISLTSPLHTEHSDDVMTSVHQLQISMTREIILIQL